MPEQPRAFCAVEAESLQTALAASAYRLDLTFSATTFLMKPAVLHAIELWNAASGLRLRWIEPGGGADLLASFESGDHGDGGPFTGPGGIVAHAVSLGGRIPPSIQGQMHFDASENWRMAPAELGSISLFRTMVHEAGHALRLRHSRDSDSVMYPWIYSNMRGLGGDDEAAIQALYGAPVEEPAPAPPPEPSPPPEPPPPPGPRAGDPFPWRYSARDGWNAEINWLINAAYEGQVFGRTLEPHGDRLIGTLGVDKPWEPDA